MLNNKTTIYDINAILVFVFNFVKDYFICSPMNYVEYAHYYQHLLRAVIGKEFVR